MSILLMDTTLSLSACPVVLPQYSQNELNTLSSVMPIDRRVKAIKLGYNSTFSTFDSEQSNAFYDVLESHVEHEDNDYGEDIQLQSFAKSSFQVKIKVENIEKLNITV